MKANLNIGIFWIIIFACSQVYAQPDPSALNSPFDERGPVFSPDGNTLYFIRRNHPQNRGGVKDPGDIWYATLSDDNTWGIPQKLGDDFNNENFNGVIGFSSDGNTMYLYGHYTRDGSRPRTQGISRSFKTATGWSPPQAIPIEHFMNKSEERGISLSSDGRTMVMSLESYGSYGAEDLYVSFLRPDGKWSQPRNLGHTLNTSGQENTPWLAYDNRSLYFSSNGYEGLGSRDIFVTYRLDDSWQKWSNPENLGPIVNSEGLELDFQLIGDDMGMFISTLNSDGYGDIKIRKFESEEIAKLRPDTIIADVDEKTQDLDLRKVKSMESGISSVTVFGAIKNASNQEPLQADIAFESDDFNTRVNSEVSTGTYSVQLPADREYTVSIKASGYLGNKENITLTGNSNEAIELNFVLYPLEVGTTINLRNVHFYRGTADLIETSFEQLDLVIEVMKNNPDMEIELSGHTDNRGSFKLNLELSNQRVEKVKEYLVSKGIDPDRISGKGYGSTRPIASNASEETRKLNRRVEFTIVKD